MKFVRFVSKATPLLLAFLLQISVYSQAPQGFTYQAVVRNGSGAPIADQFVGVEITLQNTLGTVLYAETHRPKTNAQGVMSITIGEGTLVGGNAFASVPWKAGDVLVKVRIDPAGGTAYAQIGEPTELKSVPYALFAENTKEVVSKPDAAADDPIFEVKNKLGQVVFGVYQGGVRVYVEDTQIKGAKGGFAVGGLSQTKAGNQPFYLKITPDTARININDSNTPKGAKGGFAVGGMSQTKAGGYSEYLRITPDSTSITTSNQSKRVTIKNPNDSIPLLNIDGSIKMGYDSIRANGIMGYNGSKFLTYEKSDTAWKQFVVTGIPEVITDSVYSISRSTAAISGNVIKDGGSEVVARGVCWNTIPSPTLMNNNLISGNGKGHFSMDITGLRGATTYYLRTFATNSKFTNYSEELIVNTLPPISPTVTTTPISSITATTASSGGNVTDNGADYILARGVCWNITGEPTIADDYTVDGTLTGEFTSNLSSLLANKTYFVRAYATNSMGTVYGTEYSFATSDLPVLSTNPITAVTGSSATTGGNIFAGGELSITQRGVCWNTTGNPTLEDLHTTNGSGTGSFTSNITGLSLGATYFVRAYAVNTSGAAYGNEYFFTTLNLPTITTNAASLISGTTATCGGNISYNGGAVVTTRGICWNTTGVPTLADSHIAIGDGTGNFSTGLAGLTIGTTYFIRAYATNSIGTAYGNQQSFTTQNFASVITSAVTSITYTTATGGGNITSDGGALITQRGICWNTTGAPLIAENHTENGSGAGVFTSNLTGLAANNTYHVRAYAKNSIGTTYGQEVDFPTPTIVPPEPGLPVIGTIAITTSSNVYNTGGYISYDGGTAVTQRGVCWSTSQNPTFSDSHTTDGTGTGLFSSTISSIIGCGTTYYIRAYAKNSLGTGYGNQILTTSGLLITIVTNSVTNITKTSAIIDGIITGDGGCEITERGICWSSKPNPTIGNNISQSGIGMGSFSASMAGLYPNYTYYVRTYATNSQGTAYGSELTFKTQAGTSGAAIGQFYAGGYVFYLDATGDHGLVSAPTNSGTAPWGCIGTLISSTQMGVGTGITNTAIIIANCAEVGIAARICDQLEINGYTDWFLPSIDELNLMFINLHKEGIGGFENTYYWSSSENSLTNAWKFAFFSNGFQFAYLKDVTLDAVHAVRAF